MGSPNKYPLNVISFGNDSERRLTRNTDLLRLHCTRGKFIYNILAIKKSNRIFIASIFNKMNFILSVVFGI